MMCFAIDLEGLAGQFQRQHPASARQFYVTADGVHFLVVPAFAVIYSEFIEEADEPLPRLVVSQAEVQSGIHLCMSRKRYKGKKDDYDVLLFHMHRI